MGTVVLLVLSGLILVIFALLLVYFVILFDSAVGKLDFTSNGLVAAQVINIIKQRHLENGNFYDLGSARGTFAAKIAKGLPKLWVYGIDDSRLRVFCSKARSRFLHNLKFKKQDIFTANISDADIIYLYLPQELMPALQTKLQKELKRGSLVISTSVHFENLQPSEVLIIHQDKPDFEKVFVYNFV